MADVNVSGLPIRPQSRAASAPGLACAVLMLTPGVAEAFPPYRSTDGAPATPYELGVRLGLGKFQRDGGRSAVTAPLLRASLGLPERVLTQSLRTLSGGQRRRVELSRIPDLVADAV